MLRRSPEDNLHGAIERAARALGSCPIAIDESSEISLLGQDCWSDESERQNDAVGMHS